MRHARCVNDGQGQPWIVRGGTRAGAFITLLALCGCGPTLDVAVRNASGTPVYYRLTSRWPYGDADYEGKLSEQGDLHYVLHAREGPGRAELRITDDPQAPIERWVMVDIAYPRAELVIMREGDGLEFKQSKDVESSTTRGETK